MRPVAMIRWSTTTPLFFHFGVIGQAAYLSDPSKEVTSVWLFIGLVMLPFVLLLFVRQGEQSDGTVARAHLAAALGYLALSSLVAAFAAAGYQPVGWWFFIALMAPGVFISMLHVGRRLSGPPRPTLSAD